MSDVVWVPAYGLNGRYEVSSDGRIRSIGSDSGWSRWKEYQGKELKPCRTSGGYMQVSVRVGGIEKSLLLHRLILCSFTNENPKGKHCCHNNGNRADNRISNLRWGTPKENHDDMDIHGTKRTRSNGHHATKLSESDMDYIMNSPLPGAELARRFGVSHRTINGYRKAHGWDKGPDGYRLRVEDVS